MLRPVTIASTRCEYASGAARRARTASGSRSVVVDLVDVERRLRLQARELRADGVGVGRRPAGAPRGGRA